ncbi:MAG: tyrosine-protein phosphatase [Wenzhouxiangella sp.]
MYTDLHCHILPGIDDGARDMAQALAMARLAVEDDIRCIVVTPHHLNGVYDNPADRVLSAMAALQAELQANDIELELRPGAELHLVPELPKQLASGQALTVANRGRAVLVELPVHTVPMGSDLILEQILAQGLTPIIAHPERNSQLRQELDRLAEWVEFGCLAQITGQSCTGRFGPQVRDTARQMIQRGLIHVVASDAHRDQRRIPELSSSHDQVADWIGEEAAELIVVDWPRQLADGEAPDSEALSELLRQRPTDSWWRRLWQR